MTWPDKYYLHFLNCFQGFGPKRLGRLNKYFPDYATAFAAPSNDLLDAGMEPHIIEQWLAKRDTINLEESAQQLQKTRIKLLTYKDEQYPEILRQIPQAPQLLYYRGELAKREEFCFAVVGTRKISAYGRSITPELVAPLVTSGMTIVSGLAYGVDKLAHETALDNKGRTIAVLGCGLDDATIYPHTHLTLAQEIIDKGGLLLSEYAPGHPALPQNFVARNRIISGLSKGVLVVECDLESGALITAGHAADQSREVYAPPGLIYSPTSQGTNQLIKQGGAKFITSGQDIVEDLQLEIDLHEAPKTFVTLTHKEQIILNLISNNPVLVDDLITIAPLPPHLVTAAITLLEIKGQIRNVGGQQYVRKEKI